MSSTKYTADLMALIVGHNADSYNLFRNGKLSEEKLQQIINTTNIYITKCENVLRGIYE